MSAYFVPAVLAIAIGTSRSGSPSGRRPSWPGPRKDTAIVLPKTLTVFFDADNLGQWMLHCHNAYHGEAGMMVLVGYQG